MHVVCPRYRTIFDGKYPAAINNLHAGYQYVVEHAEDLAINPDKIVLYGASSGSNLILSLTFRLKRYGYSPRGCIADCCFADHRPIYATSTIQSGGNWDGKCQWLSSMEYLGANDIAWADDPEMYPMYATAEDCVGLYPIFMHPDSEEASSGSCRAFIDVLSKAGVYNELHLRGGSCHAAIYTPLDESEYAQRFTSIVDGNIKDCMKYDLRRCWITTFDDRTIVLIIRSESKKLS